MHEISTLWHFFNYDIYIHKIILLKKLVFHFFCLYNTELQYITGIYTIHNCLYNTEYLYGNED